MTDLSNLARRILQFTLRFLSPRRTRLFILLFVIALVSAQPLLVNAKPLARGLNQLAGIAQVTPSPQEEPATESDAEENGDEEDGESNDAEIAAENVYSLPFAWEGEASVSIQALAEVAPPLQAEASQGDFQVAFVPAETGDVLRILPVATAGDTGSVRIGINLDEGSTNPPFPAGQTLFVQLAARVYAPDAATRLTIRETLGSDDSGSSSTAIDGLNWNDYQLTRQIDGAATEVAVFLEWTDVPANGWLEVSDLSVAIIPPGEAIALSPTDTPVEPDEAGAAQATPQLDVPTPTATVSVTPTPLPTATPIPDSVAIQAAPPQATTNEATTTEAITDPAAVSDSTILTPTPTFVVVTSTPTPVDVFEEATRVAQATEWAHILGPVTPTPPNLATPTPSSTPFIVVLVNTPTPANAATATQVALLATAIAFTTGTPTPIPPEATVVIATETPLPPAPTSRPTPTPTPIYVLVENIPVVEAAPPPLVPEVLHNKIIFLTAFRGDPRRPNAMSINPDGTELALMTSNLFHALAASRDTLSADQRFHVFTIPEAGGEAHNAGRWQLFYDDRLYESYKHQLTYFGAGGAWDAVWSPTSETIAFVANETGNEEIWVTERGQYPARQLTQNEWEWDNNPSFSPDGSEIVFMSNRVTGSRQLWIMPAGGGEARQLTNLPYEAWDPVWVKYVEGQ